MNDKKKGEVKELLKGVSQKKYRVGKFTYSFVEGDSQSPTFREKTVTEYEVQFDSLSELEARIECDFGKIFSLSIEVRT